MADKDIAGNNEETFGHASWIQKFAVSIRGLLVGIRGGGARNSFAVHLPVAIIVLIAAIVLKFTPIAIAVLVCCIGLVIVSELFNSCIESLSRAITREHNEHVGLALDIASGAVLAASLNAVVVGGILFGHRLMQMFMG